MNNIVGEGAKEAGYIRAMVAKDSGKIRKDYTPKPPKKKIGKFNINKMSNPSDNLMGAYVDTYKAKPAKTWGQVKNESANIKEAVRNWMKMNPNKSERDIAKDTGLSQPTINRYKRVSGGAKDDLTAEEKANRSSLLTFPQSMSQLNRTLDKLEAETARDYADAENTAMEIGIDTPIVTELKTALDAWVKERIKLYGFIKEYNQGALEERMDNLENEVDTDENPNEEVSDAEGALETLQSMKEAYIAVLIIIKQIKRALVRQLLYASKTDPTSNIPVRLKKDIKPEAKQTEIMNVVFPKEGSPPTDVELIQQEDADEPTTQGGAKPILRLYHPNGKVYKGNYHIMSDGKVHTGIKHTKASKLLTIK